MLVGVDIALSISTSNESNESSSVLASVCKTNMNIKKTVEYRNVEQLEQYRTF